MERLSGNAPSGMHAAAVFYRPTIDDTQVRAGYTYPADDDELLMRRWRERRTRKWMSCVTSLKGGSSLCCGQAQ